MFSHKILLLHFRSWNILFQSSNTFHLYYIIQIQFGSHACQEQAQFPKNWKRGWILWNNATNIKVESKCWLCIQKDHFLQKKWHNSIVYSLNYTFHCVLVKEWCMQQFWHHGGVLYYRPIFFKLWHPANSGVRNIYFVGIQNAFLQQICKKKEKKLIH